jgi:hypothetical protein
MQDSLANYLFDPFDGGIKGMLTNFIDILRRMAAEMAASSIFDFIGGAATKSAGSGGFLGAIGGFFSKLGKRAAGGPVGAGMPYLVGELGPELFVPNVSGYVQPNGGGGVSMNVSIDARGATNPAQMLVAMKLAKDAAIAQIRDQQKRGRR